MAFTTRTVPEVDGVISGKDGGGSVHERSPLNGTWVQALGIARVPTSVHGDSFGGASLAPTDVVLAPDGHANTDRVLPPATTDLGRLALASGRPVPAFR